jgi:hypothetical protein
MNLTYMSDMSRFFQSLQRGYEEAMEWQSEFSEIVMTVTADADALVVRASVRAEGDDAPGRNVVIHTDRDSVTRGATDMLAFMAPFDR